MIVGDIKRALTDYHLVYVALRLLKNRHHRLAMGT